MSEELQRAREHCFMAGVGDAGMQLCEANVLYGLAKIQHVQRQLGFPADATFVGAPDATVTRNSRRWSQGFGYGGSYQWTGEFTVLDLKPNACGMLAGALPRLPALNELRERLHIIDRDGLKLDGVALDNDLTESNHFVDLLTVNEQESTEPAPLGATHYFIMHSSGHEHRGATDRGIGLYYDESELLGQRARVVDTPWGSLHILEGAEAEQFWEFYQRTQDFNHRRREHIARALFDDFQTVVNATHQGLTLGYNRANIGCYTFSDERAAAQQLFPLTLSPDLPAFFVRAQTNIGDAALELLGWRERAERHGVLERVRNVNILPHGGGYTFPQLAKVAAVHEDGPDQRRFELARTDGGAPIIIDTPRGLDYAYRGMEVKQRMEELDLGQTVVTLDLEYVLR